MAGDRRARLRILHAATRRRGSGARRRTKRSFSASGSSAQMREARLQSLHAQMEPHFLFNTLATVSACIVPSPSAGARCFPISWPTWVARCRKCGTTKLLSGKSSSSREPTWSAARANGRAAEGRFDVPSEYAALPFPPLKLSTPRERRSSTGSIPCRKGCDRNRARVETRSCASEVSVPERACARVGGSGAGLANLRARLAALYGEAAGLEFKANVPRGIRVTIVVPVEAPSA